MEVMIMKLSSTQKKLLAIAAVSGSLAVISLVDDIGTEFELYKNVINNHADHLVALDNQVQKVAAAITLGK